MEFVDEQMLQGIIQPFGQIGRFQFRAERLRRRLRHFNEIRFALLLERQFQMRHRATQQRNQMPQALPLVIVIAPVRQLPQLMQR